MSNDSAEGVNTPDINTIQYRTFLWCILHYNRSTFSYERVTLHQESNLREMTQLTQLLCESEAQCINNNSFYPSLLRELTRCLKGTNYISVASMSCLCVSTY